LNDLQFADTDGIVRHLIVTGGKSIAQIIGIRNPTLLNDLPFTDTDGIVRHLIVTGGKSIAQIVEIEIQSF
jgi:hypothetical protein